MAASGDEWCSDEDDESLEARRRAQVAAEASEEPALPEGQMLLVPQPPPSYLNDPSEAVQEAMRRLGIVPEDVMPKAAHHFKRQGMSRTEAVRKAAMAERSRMLLLDKLEAKMAEMEEQANQGNRRTPRSTGKRGAAPGGSPTAYTIEGINKQRMASYRQAMRHTLQKTIQKKVDELEHEKQCVEYDQKVRVDSEKRRQAAQQARRVRDMQILHRLSEEYLKRQQVQEHIEDCARQREQKYEANRAKREENAKRRKELLRGRAAKTALYQHESIQCNAELKAQQRVEQSRFVQKVEMHRRNVSDKGAEAKELRLQRVRERARERDVKRNTTLDRARVNEETKRDYHTYKIKAFDKRVDDVQRQHQAARLSFRVTAALRDDYRRAVKDAHDRANDEFQESCELYTMVNDTFTRKNLEHLSALRDEKRQAIAHVNEEKQRKAVRARLAQQHREETIRQRAESRIGKYNALLTELDRGWQQVSDYGEKARRQARIIRAVSNTVGGNKAQLATLRGILKQTMTPMPDELAPQQLPVKAPDSLTYRQIDTDSSSAHGAPLDPNQIDVAPDVSPTGLREDASPQPPEVPHPPDGARDADSAVSDFHSIHM
eukprot:TRINITY_DN18518_c0_g1_i1.p1 TRINITY_DN18518_c0_g1~~TRINITY_DN18518_c0_g1_i1.p1  ORF type:complete len:619 (+),score=184.07 TRINITY_DN18518_c0_g1_i1:47-1858(+)